MAVKRKWIGFSVMGLAFLVVIASGILAFAGVMSTGMATTIIQWSVILIFLPGFVLHMSAVINQWKEKSGQDSK